MKVNDVSNYRQATVNDNRITKIGHIMRKTSLDEIPQFINVLLGQMSVVGPHPHMLKQTEVFSGLIDYYMMRHGIKPGVTGLAQVNGYRGETDELWKMEKQIRYDIEYIKKNGLFGGTLGLSWKQYFVGELIKMLVRKINIDINLLNFISVI